MQKLRIGVTGLGLIGSLHARILHELPNAELAAVADVNMDTAKTVAGQCGNCKPYASLKEMCEKEQLDAVSICTPDEFHMEDVTVASGKGLHILLEKPIATTELESRQIVAATEKSNVRLMIAHVLHFDPRYAQIREAIEQDKFGDIIHMYFRRTNPRANGRRLGGKVSIFHYIGIHDFEMMCAYMRAKPTRAYCQQVSKINADIGCEDTTISTINFDNGAIGLIELCWVLPQNDALGINTYAAVIGRDAAGYVDIHQQGVSIVTEDALLYPDTLHWPTYNGKVNGDLKEEIAHFVSATLDGSPYITKTENAIQAVRIIEACFKSIETGLPVDI